MKKTDTPMRPGVQAAKLPKAQLILECLDRRQIL